MASDEILYDVADGIATITLNRPHVMNAFAGTMREDLLTRLDEAAADSQVHCVVITGAGKAFCAGGDIANMADLQARGDTQVIGQRMQVAAAIVRRLRAMPKPVIAAVNGAAAGAGMNLALACDIRFAAANATFAESFVKIGLVPDWGGHYLLTQLVGTARALEILMSGESIDAATALQLGIVNRVFANDVFAASVRARAVALASGPGAALAAIKRGVYLATRGTLEETLTHEMAAQGEAFLSADAREGVRAFLDKRPPRFGIGIDLGTAMARAPRTRRDES